MGLIVLIVAFAAPGDRALVVEENSHKVNPVTKQLLLEKEEQEEVRIIVKGNARGLDRISGSHLSRGKIKISNAVALLKNPLVEKVELDMPLPLLNDEITPNVELTGAPSAWPESQGEDIKVAILDTGIASHNDLSATQAISVINTSPEDNYGHGTAMAGVLAAILNNEGLSGIAPEASVYSVKVTDGSQVYLSDAIAGLEWAIDNDIDIVSMSFGSYDYSEIFKEVVDEGYEKGILLIAPTGNDGVDEVMYPARYATVVAVGGVDNGSGASFSNYGDKMELVASAVEVNSTSLDGAYVIGSGTSYSAPHVAGVAALVWSHNPELSNVQVRGKLQNDAKDLGVGGWDEEFGVGSVWVNLSSENYELLKEWNDTVGNDTKDNITLLVDTIGNIVYSDDYSVEGDLHDGVVWVNGNLDIALDNDLARSHSNLEAECYDVPLTLTDYEYCYFIDSTAENDCDANDGLIDCASADLCSSPETIGENRSMSKIDTSSTARKNQRGHYFDDCSTSIEQWRTHQSTYHVINKKQAVCINSTHYKYQGHDGTGWFDYGDTQQCSVSCNTALDEQEITSKNNPIPSPCSGNETDLEIVSVIPIQVIPDVDMVKDKSGFIRVVVRNNGNTTANGKVTVIFDSNILSATSGFGGDTKSVTAGGTQNYTFDFKPGVDGNNLIIQTNLTVI